MKEHPIIFSTDMVRAILEGRKTQTRRVIDFGRFFSNNEHFKNNYKFEKMFYDDRKDENVAIFGYKPEGSEYGFTEWFKYPHGQVGDRLWVRETWHKNTGLSLDTVIHYKADGAANLYSWKPSIFMPRWASRITLEITEVRVERLQEITLNDCNNEGIKDKVEWIGNDCLSDGIIQFSDLWNSINAKRGYGWEVNPWVWVISFRRS